jgi:hypothetical protein
MPMKDSKMTHATHNGIAGLPFRSDGDDFTIPATAYIVAGSSAIPAMAENNSARARERESRHLAKPVDAALTVSPSEMAALCR